MSAFAPDLRSSSQCRPAKSGYTEFGEAFPCSSNCGCAKGWTTDGDSGGSAPCDRGMYLRRKRRRCIHHLKRVWVFVLTYFVYLSFHAVRKPPSVVKNAWHRNCTEPPATTSNTTTNATIITTNDGEAVTPPLSASCSWSPFEAESNYATLFGVLDNSYLFAYALGMFLSGPVVERLDLTLCLGSGMVASGVFSILLGVAYYRQIHNLWYFVGLMAASGLVNASGWPPLASILGSWFPKDKRGLLFGAWNSCTSAGNIVGTMLAARFVNDDWGMSFVAPAVLIFAVSVVVVVTFSFLPTDASAGLDDDSVDEDYVTISSSATTLVTAESSLIHSAVDDDEGETAPLLSSGGSRRRRPRRPLDVIVKPSRGAISFCGALRIPGVMPYTLSLFFIKLVSYTFLFWLPIYIKHSTDYDPSESAGLSVAYDVGGAAGAIITGFIADRSDGRSASVCVAVLLVASPAMYLYQHLCERAAATLTANIALLFVIGAVINGPYSLISTAVAVDLGSHHSLTGDEKALSTVSSIIDGGGSVGAAVGPLLTGLLVTNFDWSVVFFMLITANLMAVVPLAYVVVRKRR